MAYIILWKKVCLHDISIQNPQSNVRDWFWHKSGLIWPWIAFEVILHLMKDLRLHNVGILVFCFNRLGVKQKNVYEDNK